MEIDIDVDSDGDFIKERNKLEDSQWSGLPKLEYQVIDNDNCQLITPGFVTMDGTQFNDPAMIITFIEIVKDENDEPKEEYPCSVEKLGLWLEMDSEKSGSPCRSSPSGTHSARFPRRNTAVSLRSPLRYRADPFFENKRR